MEEGVKGVIIGLLVVGATLFSIFCCYGLIYIWIREYIDYYIRGITPSTTSTGDNEESSLPSTRRRNFFLLPMVLAFPLATWLCLARLLKSNNLMFALLCMVSFSNMNYYLSHFYVKSGKWLVSRGCKYNSPYSEAAVYLLIGGLIGIGGFQVKYVEGHAIIAALTITIMSVIGYTWKKDTSGITYGTSFGYLVLQFSYYRYCIWYKEWEVTSVLLFPLFFSSFATMIQYGARRHQGKEANALKLIPV